VHRFPTWQHWFCRASRKLCSDYLYKWRWSTIKCAESLFVCLSICHVPLVLPVLQDRGPRPRRLGPWALGTCTFTLMSSSAPTSSLRGWVASQELCWIKLELGLYKIIRPTGFWLHLFCVMTGHVYDLCFVLQFLSAIAAVCFNKSFPSIFSATVLDCAHNELYIGAVWYQLALSDSYYTELIILYSIQKTHWLFDRQPVR